MSGLSNDRADRLEGLLNLFYAVLNGNNTVKTIEKSRKIIDEAVPSDIIFIVDRLEKSELSMDKLKIGVNKFLNLMYKTVEKYPYIRPSEGSFLHSCIKNNEMVQKRLASFRNLIFEINKTPENQDILKKMLNELRDILLYEKYYTIKENIIFPLLEKEWKEYNCVKVMWSFHDDIRRNLKSIINILSNDGFNLKNFNKLIGQVYFYMNAIIFRDEKILFPYMQETISEKVLNSLHIESNDIGFPYFKPEIYTKTSKNTSSEAKSKEINLDTGSLSVKQIILLFNHLPVDITFVDELGKVKYFSSPKNRIFPRTKSIIGRDVKNCHPSESVHIVEQIIEAFKNGTKDEAEFRLYMGKNYILIRYFAIRDEKGTYRGVLEVSQEITKIKNLKGNKRLLDWNS